MLDRAPTTLSDPTVTPGPMNASAKYRVPLVLAYFNQFRYDEIAEQLNISRTHVGVLLLRAKQRLRADLINEGGEGGQ